MSVSKQDKDVIERVFKAMQTGREAENDMLALFAEDAVFTEPFSGEPQTHEGKAAIRQCFLDMWSEDDPSAELIVDRIDLDGDRISAEWTCHSAAFTGPMRGVDKFVIENGLIRYLEVTVTDMPPMDMAEGAEH